MSRQAQPRNILRTAGVTRQTPSFSEVRIVFFLMLADGATWFHSLFEHLFVGPMWPASILATIVLALVLISLLGAFSPDFGFGGPDIDTGVDLDPGMHLDPGVEVDAGTHLDTGAHVDTSVDGHGHHVPSDVLGGLTAATMRAVHLDRVPLMVWLTMFALFFWVLSFVLWFEFDVKHYQPALWTSVLLTIRNGVIAVVLTRFSTAPLHRLLIPPTQHHPTTLVGGTAVVETSTVDDTFGRARYATNAAPLLIDIRTCGEPIAKGTHVHIIRYDRMQNVYQVEVDKR